MVVYAGLIISQLKKSLCRPSCIKAEENSVSEEECMHAQS